MLTLPGEYADKRVTTITYETFKLFGYPLTPISCEQLVSSVVSAARSRERLVVASQNLHAMRVYLRSPEMRWVHDRSLVHIDGVPIVLLARLFGKPLRFQHRTAWHDFVWPLLGECARQGLSVYWLGGSERVIQKGVAEIRRRCPDLRIGYRNGYFAMEPGSPEFEEVIDTLNRFAPDVLIVGMGMPRQEYWIRHAYDRVKAPVIMTSGGCIGVIAGEIGMAPRWMGRLGLEWLYRLIDDPKHCAPRYLVEPWVVAAHLIRFAATGRRIIEH